MKSKFKKKILKSYHSLFWWRFSEVRRWYSSALLGIPLHSTSWSCRLRYLYANKKSHWKTSLLHYSLSSAKEISICFFNEVLFKKNVTNSFGEKIVRKIIACFVSLTFPLEQHFSVSLVKQLRNLLLQITKVRIVSKRHSSHLWLYGWHQGYFHFHHGLSHVFLFTNKSDFSVRTL